MVPPSARWQHLPLCVLDTESTGLDPFADRLVELAALVVAPGGETLRSFATLLNPDRPIPPAATEVHGISDEMVAEAPTFAEVVPELLAVVGDAPIVVAAYNATFDRTFLGVEFVRAEDDVPWWLRRETDWLDPLTWAQAAQPFAKGSGRFKLANVAARLGVPQGTGHRALGDCETTARILRVLSGPRNRQLAEQPPALWGDLVKFQKLLAAEREFDFLRWLSRQQPLQTSF